MEETKQFKSHHTVQQTRVQKKTHNNIARPLVIYRNLGHAKVKRLTNITKRNTVGGGAANT